MKLTAGFALSSIVLPSRIAIAETLHDWLMAPVVGDDGLRRSELTGELSSQAFDLLWALFERIGALWELSAFTTIDRTALRDVFDLKAGETPSYLTEYIEGAEVVRHTIDRLGNGAEGLDLLIAGKFDGADIAVTRLGRLRRHVMGELITLQVSHGGFRRFGYANYRGYKAGPFSDPDNLPYRGMS